MQSKLFANDCLIGRLTRTDDDWPRVFYQFEPTSAYDSFRSSLDKGAKGNSFEKRLAAAEKIDLRQEWPNGFVRRLKFIALDEEERWAMIRAGHILDSD